VSAAKRDALLDVAEALFYRDGFHATGVDAIQAASGIAKTTLYHHFKTKDDLILAVLERAAERARRQLDKLADAGRGRGAARLAAIFDDLRNECQAPGFNGCLFNNAAAEFFSRNPAIVALAQRHNAWIAQLFARILTEEGLNGAIAPAVLALYEGIIALGRVQPVEPALGACTAWLNALAG